MIPWLAADPEAPFPPADTALVEPDGLLAAGGDLSVPRLLNAYRHGIFPWFSEDDPILWWSPNPRMIIRTDEVHRSRRLQRLLRKGQFQLTLDTAFEQVIEACSAPRDGESGTWILPVMKQAYAQLHRAGQAHSLEVWMDGLLAGGIYGVCIGRMFFGESMFHHRTDASKIALVSLCHWLAKNRIDRLDCQVQSPHLIRMGAVLISRRDFLNEISERCNQAPIRFPQGRLHLWNNDEE